MISVFELSSTLKTLGIKLSLDDQERVIIRGEKQKLTSELVSLIREMKPEIVLLLKARQLKKRNSNISVIERECFLSLSFPQQRLWLLDQIDGGSAHYNMPAALKLLGKLDVV
ncbi:hypothetical protein, partial [Motilimonas pumila]